MGALYLRIDQNMSRAKNIFPMSLYVHFPWCLRKCPYCDFNSYTLPKLKQQELFIRYVNQLLIDLKNEATSLPNHELSSIYFGGGTPSLLLPSAIKKILNTGRNFFAFTPDIEITLEANPENVNEEYAI